MKKDKQSMKDPYPLSFGEEIGNTISHGVMWVLVLFLLPFFAVRSYILGGIPYSVGISIYMICMFFMYMGSTLYHSAPYHTTHKYVFRKLDHIMITLAIAGTYTPICIMILPSPIRWILLTLEWVLAFIGILLKAISSQSHPKLSMTIYMTMGWLAIFMLPTLWAYSSTAFLICILLGGIFYTIGAFFYAHPEKNYFHFVWHIFINLASILHFIAIAFFIK